ncbi:gamma-glutamyltransferase family protein [Alicyclobacillus sp. SO9]|uniref:gamma-glutamyltransferase family protein n=1 Tax=Alicyclobacillus sp. SO9 TaxID=2665646 RepID=UPI0018E8531C|nr:gamma-glutamyltransferase family protein [Alicyclobacillus sp. SO9]QQE81091.1 gamma-glutamyltransferase family protein [Alicyclobacillus sp. SO9]
MVATSQPLAAQAGMDIMKRGGNAVDAAIATAAALTVVEPTSNGIGGDAFAIVWTNGQLHGLNSSGQAPKTLTLEKVKSLGLTEMPKFGWVPVTVPGVPGAWAELSRKFGKLPLHEVLEPAAVLAETGHPVAPTVAKYWQAAFRRYQEVLKGEEFKYWFETFANQGRPPQPGELWASQGHADTLREIGESSAQSFYQGSLAKQIASFAKDTGGFISEEDLGLFQPEWVHPISVRYHGYDVWELPPNGQGLITLMALNILDGYEFPHREAVETYHRQIEAIKLAFADGKKYITDPHDMTVATKQLLSRKYADERRKIITDTALEPFPGRPDAGGTVYLATADNEGNMVSFIQSNYMGFGSGLVVPGTGIALQNRGHTFSLDDAHLNALRPGKRTYHTIIPGFLTKDGAPVGPFGVMGGYMQPQGHLQVVMNTVDFHMNPQAALDAPRWQWLEGKKCVVERGVPEHLALGLAERGHGIEVANDTGGFGRGQIIWRMGNGVLAGGTEPRADGTIAAW